MTLEEYVPIHRTGKGTLVNELNTILMAETIKDLGHNKALMICEKFDVLDDDILYGSYPHFMILKNAFLFKAPLKYYYIKDMPLFVEYDDRAYLIAPAVDSMDDLNNAIEKALNRACEMAVE